MNHVLPDVLQKKKVELFCDNKLADMKIINISGKLKYASYTFLRFQVDAAKNSTNRLFHAAHL
jgi:hypothetical protein